LERAPILNLGQFFLPPAESYVLVGPELARYLLVAAWGFAIALSLALLPLFARSRTARFWATGFVFSLVPASGTFPHNRQLILASVGAMALLAEFWQLYALKLAQTELPPSLRLSRGLGKILLAGHVLVSPLALPLASVGVAFTKFVHTSIAEIADEIAGRDAIFVTLPEYYTLTIAQVSRRLEQKPLPRRWRALSFGPQPVNVRRVDERTLWLDYEGGILNTPLMEIYRDRRLKMSPGDRVSLEGLSIEVREVTADGRARSATFRFDRTLEADSLRFYAWSKQGFIRFLPPRVGESRNLPAPPTWGQEELEWLKAR
jgi:hypothetical protein